MTQSFAGRNLVGVTEAKPICGHIPGFSDIRDLLTLANVDGDLTPLSATLRVLTAIILGTLPNTKSLQGAYMIFGKPSMFRQ
jgi:hypothetical protein